MLRSFAELSGEVQSKVKDTPAARAQLDGVAPGKITYPERLSRQSKAMQDHVLGPERGKLFRNDPIFKGKLDKFVDSTGRRYTLEELATHEGDLLASHP